MHIDLATLKPLIDERLVNVQKHPSEDLFIYNYSQLAQFRGEWPPELRICRGLILDSQGTVIARPFDKFFNYDQHIGETKLGEIPNCPFRPFDKLDGSLGILYWNQDKTTPSIATRGSFTSEQAIWATDKFQRYANYDYFNKEYTYLFEIVVKWNRIVVDYDFEGLTLLAIRDIESGTYVDLPQDTREMQKGPSRNDRGEHISPSKGVENVPNLSKRELQEGQGEIRKRKKREYETMEKKESSQIERTGDEKLLESAGVPRQGKECPVCGLRRDVPTLRDGLRPQEGIKDDERGEVPQSEENNSGDKKVRYCVCELPQNTNLDEEIFRISSPLTDYLTPRDNAEGAVLYFENGFMCKVKYEEYVRLHRLVTGVNAKSIWELLRYDQTFDELLDRVPDEFYQWVKDTKGDLERKYADIFEESVADLKSVRQLASRKDQALWLQSHSKYLSVVFAMLDGKGPDDLIWRLIRPHADQPYKKDIDA